VQQILKDKRTQFMPPAGQSNTDTRAAARFFEARVHSKAMELSRCRTVDDPCRGSGCITGYDTRQPGSNCFVTDELLTGLRVVSYSSSTVEEKLAFRALNPRGKAQVHLQVQQGFPTPLINELECHQSSITC
jgi:hypothetical protein